MLLSVFAHISDYRPVCRVSHTSCYIEPFLFSCLNTNNSSKWTACRTSRTPWSGWPFLLCCLITNSSSEWTVCYTSHTPSYGYTFLLFCLIANSSLNWTICPTSHTQLKSEPCLMAPPSQMFYTFLTVLLHHRLRLLHRTQFRRRVSDHSVALAATCSSGAKRFFYFKVNWEDRSTLFSGQNLNAKWRSRAISGRGYRGSSLDIMVTRTQGFA